MTEEIGKYPLQFDHLGRATVSMPPAAKILTLQTQRWIPTIWAKAIPVDSAARVTRRFVKFRTGWDVEPKKYERLIYVGTYQTETDHVWHVFEI